MPMVADRAVWNLLAVTKLCHNAIKKQVNYDPDFQTEFSFKPVRLATKRCTCWLGSVRSGRDRDENTLDPCFVETEVCRLGFENETEGLNAEAVAASASTTAIECTDAIFKSLVAASG